MAFELYGMLAGSVSPMTGEHIKPAYGGEDEAFLQKVVTPIYKTIAKVACYSFSVLIILSSLTFFRFNSFIFFILISLRYRKQKEVEEESRSILSGETMTT